MPTVPIAATPTRRILTAELLAIGTELTVGETLDTNSGELARSLVVHGVAVTRIADLPDDLDVVVDALRTALARADLVVTTGGLGPTPDDLTREAVAAVCGETGDVDQATLTWLEDLWARRGQPVPVGQRRSRPGSSRPPRRCPTRTGRRPAGGWTGPDGRVIVTAARPTARDAADVGRAGAPAARGAAAWARTARCGRCGCTASASPRSPRLLGEPLLRATNPVVATYARHEAVDVRISARGRRGPRRPPSWPTRPRRVVAGGARPNVWARGDDDLGRRASARRSRPAAGRWPPPSAGTGGALVVLLRDMPSLRRAEVVAIPTSRASARTRRGRHRGGGRRGAMPSVRDGRAPVRIRPRGANRRGGRRSAVADRRGTPDGHAHADERLAFHAGRLGGGPGGASPAAAVLLDGSGAAGSDGAVPERP